MTSTKRNRRAIMAGLGMAAASVTVGARGTRAQGAAAPFTPARHEQDAWISAMPGKHRVEGASPTRVTAPMPLSTLSSR